MQNEDKTAPVLAFAKGLHADGWINKQASLTITCNQPLQLYFILPEAPLLAEHKIVLVRHDGIEHRIQVKRGKATPTTYFSPQGGQLNFSFECEYPEIATHNEQRKLGVRIGGIRLLGKSPSDFVAFMRSSLQRANAVKSQGKEEESFLRNFRPVYPKNQKERREVESNPDSVYGLVENDLRGEEVQHDTIVGVPASIQCQPMNLPLLTGETGQIFVEDVSRDSGFWVVRGWTTLGSIELILHHGSNQTALQVNRHRNVALCANLGLPAFAEPVFTASCLDTAVGEAVELEIRYRHGEAIKTGSLAYKEGLSSFEKRLFPVLFADDVTQLTSLTVGSLDWGNAVSRLPLAMDAPSEIKGFIEGFMRSPEGNAIVFGWVFHPDDTPIWIESSDGEVYAPDKWFRCFRPDVLSAHANVAWATDETGFIAYLPQVSTGSRIKLCAATSRGKVFLSEQVETDVFSSDPRLAAEMLFAIESAEESFHRRAPIVDWPLIEPLIARRVQESAKIKEKVHLFGKPILTPKVSIIMPLYKRFDFIEHQIMEFCRDKSLLESTELIYVIDDPAIAQSVLAEVSALFSLYGITIKVVDGRVNRGFSGSNNLGARHAKGHYLLFMNSDVIPQNPGWLPRVRTRSRVIART